MQNPLLFDEKLWHAGSVFRSLMIVSCMHMILHRLWRYVDGAPRSFEVDCSTNSSNITDHTFDFCIGDFWVCLNVGFLSTKDVIGCHCDDTCEVVVLFHERITINYLSIME